MSDRSKSENVIKLVKSTRQFVWILVFFGLLVGALGLVGSDSALQSVRKLGEKSEEVLAEERVLIEFEGVYSGLSDLLLSLETSGRSLDGGGALSGGASLAAADVKSRLARFERELAALGADDQAFYARVWRDAGFDRVDFESAQSAENLSVLDRMKSARLLIRERVIAGRSELVLLEREMESEVRRIQLISALIFLSLMVGVCVPLALSLRKMTGRAISWVGDMGRSYEELEGEWLAQGETTETLRQQKEDLEEKQAELQEALEHAEIQKSMHGHAARRFQSLFDGLPVGCITFDASGMVMEWNKGMSEIFGKEAHFALLNPIEKIMARLWLRQ